LILIDSSILYSIVLSYLYSPRRRESRLSLYTYLMLLNKRNYSIRQVSNYKDLTILKHCNFGLGSEYVNAEI